jgi:glycosyltransferase involved in cell wall biosynthesis
MRILIVSDAWEPQVNGVVRSLRSVMAELAKMSHACSVIAPHQFRSIPCPTYPEIRLAMATPAMVGRMIDKAEPDAIHIATEGPLGVATRKYCLRRGLPFTTAYHTHFPDYVAKRTHLPASLFWRYVRWFHAPAAAILVSTETLRRQLNAHGLPQTRIWTRGVDTKCFNPKARPHPAFADLPRPIMLNVGRVAVEKNLEAFLDCTHPGSKIVVGDGPDLPKLKRRYPEVSFLGALHGDELASAYAGANVFVFPSRTDTFGLVMIEALACGTPVAAFPVPGPQDVLNGRVSAMHKDLDIAIAGALARGRPIHADHEQRFNWGKSARQFLAELAPVRPITSFHMRPPCRLGLPMSARASSRKTQTD